MTIVLYDVLSLVSNHMEPPTFEVTKIQSSEFREGCSVKLYSLDDDDKELVLQLNVDESCNYLRLSELMTGTREQLSFLFNNVDAPAYIVEQGDYQKLEFVPEIDNEHRYFLNEGSKHIGGIIDDKESLGGKSAFYLRIYEKVEKFENDDTEVVVVIEKASDLNQKGGGLVQMFKAYSLDKKDIKTC